MLSFYSLFGAWKIVGIWQWRVIGVLNIIWRKTEMEQKSDRERWGDGGRTERERERERDDDDDDDDGLLLVRLYSL